MPGCESYFCSRFIISKGKKTCSPPLITSSSLAASFRAAVCRLAAGVILWLFCVFAARPKCRPALPTSPSSLDRSCDRDDCTAAPTWMVPPQKGAARRHLASQPLVAPPSGQEGGPQTVVVLNCAARKRSAAVSSLPCSFCGGRVCCSVGFLALSTAARARACCHGRRAVNAVRLHGPARRLRNALHV